ncbi:hypothetical protein Trydic_g16963 [Trypoxylus dichotomus]
MFEIFGSRRRVSVLILTGERAIEQRIPTVKHGGSPIMIWGCFNGTAVGDIVRIEEMLKKEQYRNIIENNGISSGLRLLGPNFVLQQKSEPKHASKLCRLFGTLGSRRIHQSYGVTCLKFRSKLQLSWQELNREVRKAVPISQESARRRRKLTKLIARMP